MNTITPKAIALVFATVFVSLLAVRIVAGISFNRDCGGYLSRAALALGKEGQP